MFPYTDYSLVSFFSRTYPPQLELRINHLECVPRGYYPQKPWQWIFTLRKVNMPYWSRNEPFYSLPTAREGSVFTVVCLSTIGLMDTGSLFGLVTARGAVGTHPTGMLSCYFFKICVYPSHIFTAYDH